MIRDCLENLIKRVRTTCITSAAQARLEAEQ